jgi:prepilin-type N-terminal cleavage/methylation domain-containing protein/prepilin-type processing-associated H-X9-DG protein
MKTRPSDKDAFTLIELLVVLAAISILGSLLLPAMARTRIRSGDAGCLSNKRQMMVAWAAYAADNADIMVPNAPIGVSPSQAWIDTATYGTESWGNSSANTNPASLEDVPFFRYLTGGVTAYRCPSDNLPSANGTRLRSISMVGSMGGISQSATVRNYNSPGVVFVKLGDLTRLAPGAAIVFADESMCSLNDGYLQIDTQGTDGYFPDIPANYHDGAGSFGYADGHAEIHKWQTAPLISVPYGPAYGYPNTIVTGVTRQNVDWVWWSQHTDYNP